MSCVRRRFESRIQLVVRSAAFVVTAGKHSLGVFMPGERIGRVHGTARPADPETGARDALVFAMYHPAFALYDGSNRTTLETDIQGLPTVLESARARREAGTGPSVEAMVDTAPTGRDAEPTTPTGLDAEPATPAGADAEPATESTAPPATEPATRPAPPATGPVAAPLAEAMSALPPGVEPDADQLTLF